MNNNIDNHLIDELLNEEESSTLDFKEEQYKFVGENDIAKSELLKDILAFANSWKRTDSFILIGVKEVKGARSEVVGINQHIDDAQLQQFVNSKTQKPLTFAYKTLSFEEVQIGVIWIPVQTRPIYLKKDYGKLKSNIVYIRRGSSTAEAAPDEIAKMGNEDTSSIIAKEPNLKAYFRTQQDKQTETLHVRSIESYDQNSIIKQLNELLISDEDMNLLEKRAKELNEIIKQHPNGSTYHPYKVNKVHKFMTDVKEAIKFASTDIAEFIRHYNLSIRSLEMFKTYFAEVKQRNSTLPTYVKISISNQGFSPSENIVVYIDSNDKVNFLSNDQLKDYDITFHVGVIERIKETIDKAKEISLQKQSGKENDINRLRLGMFEASSRFNYPSVPNYDLFPHEKRIITSIKDERLKIRINDSLMHNHHMVVEADNIYLCPYLSKGEKTVISYECHANNLSIPTTGVGNRIQEL